MLLSSLIDYLQKSFKLYQDGQIDTIVYSFTMTSEIYFNLSPPVTQDPMLTKNNYQVALEVI